MGVAKVTLNGDTLIDVTQKTVTSNTMLSGITALGADGENVSGNVEGKSAANLTATGSTVYVPSGFFSSQVSKSISAGSAFPPAVTITTNPTITLNSTTGVITAAYTGSSYITPTVNAGYISQGTSGKISTTGTSTFQLTSKTAATYYPSTTDQTVASRQYLIGSQVFKSVTYTGLEAGNIASGVTVKIGDSANASRIIQVVGTHMGGITPTGNITLSSNGTFDVTNYASAIVSLPDGNGVYY